MKDTNGRVFQNKFETPKRGEKKEKETERIDENSTRTTRLELD